MQEKTNWMGAAKIAKNVELKILLSSGRLKCEYIACLAVVVLSTRFLVQPSANSSFQPTPTRQPCIWSQY
jgi:hypothetical protein